MIPNEIYKIGEDLGLTKGDIDSTLSTEVTEEDSIEHTSPVEVYKGVGRYATVSINDFE